jgi:hypothetical protein
MACTLEDLRDPERRAAYEENTNAFTLQKNLTIAIQESKQTMEDFKQLLSICNHDLAELKESKDKEIDAVVPSFLSEIERITDYFRNEMVSQKSENVKLNKQIQTLTKDQTILVQLSSEAVLKFNKVELSMEIK